MVENVSAFSPNLECFARSRKPTGKINIASCFIFNAMKLILLLVLLSVNVYAADTLSVSSPNKKTTVTITLSWQLNYSIAYGQTPLLLPSAIDLLLANGKSLNADLRLAKSFVRSVSETIVVPVAYQRKMINDQYTELTLQFKQSFSVVFRVYDDGVAYRIVTRFKDSITVKNEVASFSFPKGKKAFIPLIQAGGERDRFHTSFEVLYPSKSIDSLGEADLAYTPLLTGTENEMKVAVTESDLEDYPGMFLSGTNGSALQGVFAPYPLREELTHGEFPQAVVHERAGYIARTKGSRSFPWRVLLIAANDKDLPANDLVYRLGAPSRVPDASWINPGKGTDEWIINTNLFNVPFKSGVNTDTYKYYIDFAKRFGFQRIMMDAGWSNNSDLFQLNPAINMDTITAYAKSNGIKISMWTLASTLNRQLDSALDRFNRWGVDFIMTDFMDRDDQKMVAFYHRVAKACADHKLMIMFHGAFAPKGLNRTYPNVMTTEGLLGSEYNIWSNLPTPEHDLILPFTRMLGGPFDYEPGLLNNATEAQFRSVEGMPMSQGTRCHQLAMFVVYDNPVQFFSGNPSQGWKEPQFMELLGSIPTAWDETEILKAKVSDYIITARKKGNDWYIAGMTDWTPREFTLAFDFLEAGPYKAVLCSDGVNADKFAADYSIIDFDVDKTTARKIKMAPGGGFLLKLMKQ